MVVFDLDTRADPKVWAIGGGKGGVGKSVIAANLGTALAQCDTTVALVDLDLGGANLHTLFDLGLPRHTLADFVNRRFESIDDVLVPTPVDNLWLISGARATLDAANPKHAQKLRLIRQLKRLQVDHIVLDLGAGSAFNTLDFFLAADQGVLVVTPEPTAVENAYHFLKAAFYRCLRAAEPRNRVQSVLQLVMSERDERGVRSPKELIAAAVDFDQGVAAALAEAARRFQPAILVNRAENDGDRRLATQMATASRDYFGTSVTALAALDRDLLVTRSVRERRPVVSAYPGGPFSQGIRQLAREIAVPQRGGP